MGELEVAVMTEDGCRETPASIMMEVDNVDTLIMSV